MKSLKDELIQCNIISCLRISKEYNSIIINPKKNKSDEYLISIIFKKEYFNQKKENEIKIEKDITFMLHLVHNFPTNAPKLFCLTLLSYLGIEIGDGKDLLEDVIESNWNSKISAKSIILKIPQFIQNCFNKKYDKLYIGKYQLNYEYDYNMLLKIPHNTFNQVEQIINIKNGQKENRFLLITGIFFLLFSYKSGYFSYSKVKLVFWASIFSIYGIKQEDPMIEFGFFKNKNKKINIYLNTNEGNDILNILLYIFQSKGIDFSLQNKGLSNQLPDINAKNKDFNIEEKV